VRRRAASVPTCLYWGSHTGEVHRGLNVSFVNTVCDVLTGGFYAFLVAIRKYKDASTYQLGHTQLRLGTTK
jgi:hypothetical protein